MVKTRPAYLSPREGLPEIFVGAHEFTVHVQHRKHLGARKNVKQIKPVSYPSLVFFSIVIRRAKFACYFSSVPINALAGIPYQTTVKYVLPFRLFLTLCNAKKLACDARPSSVTWPSAATFMAGFTRSQ